MVREKMGHLTDLYGMENKKPGNDQGTLNQVMNSHYS